jgi:hypothetical protein
MELITKNKQELPSTQIENVEKEKQEFKFVGSLHIGPGMKLYACDPQERTVWEVDVNRSNSTICFMTLSAVERHKATYNPKYIYIEASNLKNAIKKSNKPDLECLTVINQRRADNALSLKVY